MGVFQSRVGRQDQDGLAPEVRRRLANEGLEADVTCEQRPRCQDEERYQHDFRRFVNMSHGRLVGPGRAVEGHNQ